MLSKYREQHCRFHRSGHETAWLLGRGVSTPRRGRSLFPAEPGAHPHLLPPHPSLLRLCQTVGFLRQKEPECVSVFISDGCSLGKKLKELPCGTGGAEAPLPLTGLTPASPGTPHPQASAGFAGEGKVLFSHYINTYRNRARKRAEIKLGLWLAAVV